MEESRRAAAAAARDQLSALSGNHSSDSEAESEVSPDHQVDHSAMLVCLSSPGHGAPRTGLRLPPCAAVWQAATLRLPSALLTLNCCAAAAQDAYSSADVAVRRVPSPRQPTALFSPRKRWRLAAQSPAKSTQTDADDSLGSTAGPSLTRRTPSTSGGPWSVPSVRKAAASRRTAFWLGL